MSARPWLLPNVGAEEGAAPALAARAIAGVARLWRLLFGPDARVLEIPEPPWPRALGDPPEGPVFPWLDAGEGLTAWLNTPEAEIESSSAGNDNR